MNDVICLSTKIKNDKRLRIDIAIIREMFNKKQLDKIVWALNMNLK